MSLKISDLTNDAAAAFSSMLETERGGASYKNTFGALFAGLFSAGVASYAQGSRNFVLSDAHKILTTSHSAGSLFTWTIPPQSSVAWEQGTVMGISISAVNAAGLNLAGGSGVTLYGTTRSRIFGPTSVTIGILLVRLSTNVWFAIGGSGNDGSS